MPTISAVVLVCLLSIPPDSCNETNAVDVIATRVGSELACSRGWQEIIARGPLREGLGEQLYLKTICRRKFPVPLPDGK